MRGDLLVEEDERRVQRLVDLVVSDSRRVDVGLKLSSSGLESLALLDELVLAPFDGVDLGSEEGKSEGKPLELRVSVLGTLLGWDESFGEGLIGFGLVRSSPLVIEGSSVLLLGSLLILELEFGGGLDESGGSGFELLGSLESVVEEVGHLLEVSVEARREEERFSSRSGESWLKGETQTNRLSQTCLTPPGR